MQTIINNQGWGVSGFTGTTFSGYTPYENPLVTGIGYDAVKPKGRRGQIRGRNLSEDQELRDNQRRQLTTTTRDINRNFAVAAWMIRRHLDYVSTFTFRSKSGDAAIDKKVEKFMEWYSKPTNCDPGGRHSFSRLVRLWEMRRVVDGDVLCNRLADGRIQTIEGDRIMTYGSIPYSDIGISDPQWVVNGVFVSPAYRAIKYMVFKRNPMWTGLVWDTAVPARFADLFGYYDRYDQVRGISPLACALNSLRDVYEGLDYALMKAKVSQMMAFAVYREGSEDTGVIEQKVGETNPQTDPEKPRYDIDFNRGPVMWDLDPGDRAEVIESQTPSNEFQHFTEAMLMVVMKSLDIPYSFYNEAHTNWVGQRQANSQYELAVQIKRQDLTDLLDKITLWRLSLAVVDGQLDLGGKHPRDLEWEWVPTKVPPIDPMKQVTADVANVNAGFDSPQQVCKRNGSDFFRIIDECADAEAYAKKKGVLMSTALPLEAFDDPNNPKTKKEDVNQESDQPDGAGKPSGKED